MEARTDNNMDAWLKFFLNGIIKTAENGVDTFADILAVEKYNEEKIQKLGGRSGNALKVLTELYKRPVLDAASVSKITGLSSASGYKLISDLENLELLKEITGGKRGKLFILKNYLDIFNRKVKYE